MDKGALVTVIIPTYNRAEVIPDAIESVLRQTHRGLRLIVVDDGSQDNTRAVVRRFARHDRRVDYIYKDNGGLATAWNAGIAAARTPWIALLDSDDQWLPKKLERQLCYAQNLPPDAPACVTDYLIVDHQKQPSTVVANSAMGDVNALILSGWGLSQGSTMLARRDTFTEIGGYDPNLRRAQDWDWLLRYSRKFRMAIMPEILTHYTESTSVIGEMKRASLQLLRRKHEEKADEYSAKELRQLTGAVAMHLARLEFRQGNYLATTGHVLNALCTTPVTTAQNLFRFAARKTLHSVNYVPEASPKRAVNNKIPVKPVL